MEKRPGPPFRGLWNGYGAPMDVRTVIDDLVAVDPRGAIWCAVLCAWTAQHLVPPRVTGPASALRLAAWWAQGAAVSPGRLRQVRSTSRVSDDACVQDATLAAYATIEALIVPDAVVDLGEDDPSATYASAAASYAARSCATFVSAPQRDRAVRNAWDDARSRHHAELAELVAYQLTPIEVDGVWPHPLGDWVAERHPKPARRGSLGDALARARQWRLRWWVPVERAIAERLIELPTWRV